MTAVNRKGLKRKSQSYKALFFHGCGFPAKVLMLVKRERVGAVVSLPLPISLPAPSFNVSVVEQGSTVPDAV